MIGVGLGGPYGRAPLSQMLYPSRSHEVAARDLFDLPELSQLQDAGKLPAAQAGHP
jgi:hypothetical protein